MPFQRYRTSKGSPLTSRMAYNDNLLSYGSPDRSIIFIRSISPKRTSILLIMLLCTILVILLSSWNLLNSVLSWYATATTAAVATPSSIWWPAIYASVAVGAIFWVLSMAAALAMAVPATVVVWISVLVLMTFAGKPRESVVVEGRKLTVEMGRTVGMVVIKEGNLVALVCAILGYFLLFRY
ncbi:hypothetical protein OSB04_014261 [Centaurea solstitialis]|uniref:Uncharacterized protein n=1 Tax=Centaurea solstitialis TaxID=347529 RepID=A0AA38TA73_9ASTR|nr:hypothetical protein OSB04_014261 [Centaurea solstitialis]